MIIWSVVSPLKIMDFKMAASKPCSNHKGKTTKHQVAKFSSKSKRKIYGKHQAGIGSSSKGHTFAEYRKLKVLNEYKKYKRQQKTKSQEKDHVSDIKDSHQQGKSERHLKMKNKYQTAEAEFQNKKAEKERLKKEAEDFHKKRTQEYEEKQEKRRETQRKLKLRTKRGQPIMSKHIEYLLEKIERK